MITEKRGKLTIGDEIVTDSGIERIIDLDDWGGYTAKTIMGKETFIEAFTKYVANAPTTDTVPMSVIEEIKAEIASYMPRKNAVLCYEILLTSGKSYFDGKTEEEIREWELASLLGSDPRQEDKGSWQGQRSQAPGPQITKPCLLWA